MAGKMEYLLHRQRFVESSAGLRTVRECYERTCIDCLSYLPKVCKYLPCGNAVILHSQKERWYLGSVGGSAAGSPCPI